VTTEFATVTFIELPVDRSDGASASRLYEGVRVPAVWVSVPVIFTTDPCANNVPPAPVVTLVRENREPI